MTAQESKQIEALTDAVGELAKQLACVKKTVELQYAHMRELCNERHGVNAAGIAELRSQDRANSSTLDKLKGMGVPVAVFVSAVSVLIAVLT